MKERIAEFLRRENKSSALFAEEIGVQPSGISHILSGRNKPSLDFILKMLEKYPYIDINWLLFGKGSMYKANVIPDLFGNYPETRLEDEKPEMDSEEIRETGRKRMEYDSDMAKPEVIMPVAEGKAFLSRIVFFYSDNSFEEYQPKKPS